MLRLGAALLSLAAAVAIAAVLSGELGETEARVSLSALAAALYGLAALAGPSAAGVAPALARACAAAALTGLALALGAIWWGAIAAPEDDEAIVRAWAAATVVAASLAQASLLVAQLRPGDPRAARVAAGATLVAIGAVGALLVAALLFEEVGEGYWRGLGALAVLDALGTALVPILRRLRPRRDRAGRISRPYL